MMDYILIGVVCQYNFRTIHGSHANIIFFVLLLSFSLFNTSMLRSICDNKYTFDNMNNCVNTTQTRAITISKTASRSWLSLIHI